MTLRVLVTGATGFLGNSLLSALKAEPTVVPVAACRRRERLRRDFTGEVRVGDLRDPAYRRALVEGIDVVCHAGTWAAMWNHQREERERFFEPAVDLLEQAVQQGVSRFILASTITVADRGRSPIDDFAPGRHTGFWPHLDRLVDLEQVMQANRGRGMQMVSMRLGHFVGAGNSLGLVPALVPRLRTRLVPWLARGERHLPLVASDDLGIAFVRATLARELDDYESFNIVGPEFPTLREVIDFIAAESGTPRPVYSVPYGLGYLFGALLERLQPLLPGASPFLTRSIVHLCEDWTCSTEYARRKLGYSPTTDWRMAVREHLADLANQGYPWPRLAQV